MHDHHNHDSVAVTTGSGRRGKERSGEMTPRRDALADAIITQRDWRTRQAKGLQLQALFVLGVFQAGRVQPLMRSSTT